MLRLSDGQVVTAELPNDELEGVELGARVWVDLRRARAFRAGDAVTEPEPAGLAPEG